MTIRAFLDKSPLLGLKHFVDPTALVIGDVELGSDCSVWPMAVLRGDLLNISVGARTNIQDNSVFHTTHKSNYNPEGHALKIGADVTIGHRVLLHGCTIGDLCLIGMGSIILDGVIIEPETMVGAGSLVPPGKILKSGWLWVGSPVVARRELSADEKKFLTYSAENYVRLKNQHLGLTT
jgi:carbonic anhydrase/acetyltransferase-like protein (isoleucine patch superfamily)